MNKEKQILQECKNLIEQNEPFQKKMKAKHSRMKKRVIGHGGQANTPPFSEKPSMERSKSAPPMGEAKEELRGGKADNRPDSDFDAEQLKNGIKQELEHTNNKKLAKEIAKDHLSEDPKYYSKLKKAKIDEALSDFFGFMTTKAKQQPKKTEYKYEEGKDYNHVFRNIYVGAAPISGGKIIDSALQTFDLIIVMSKQVADLVERNEIPKNVIIKYAIEDTINPTPEEKVKLKQAGKYGEQFIKNNPKSKVLYTCSQGLNRSAAAACITMLELGISPEEAINKVEAARGPKTLTLSGPPQEHAGFVPVIKGEDKK
jgi:hypothetical protein